MYRFMSLSVIFLTILVITNCGGGNAEKETKPSAKQPAPTVQKQPTGPSSANVVAIIDGKEVTKTDLEKYYAHYPEPLAKTIQGRKYILNQIIEAQLLEKEVAKIGISQKPEVETRVQECRDRIYREELFKKMRDEASNVSDEEVKKYYEEHKNEIIPGDRIRLGVIEVPLDKEAEIKKAYKELKAGQDFGIVAEKYSTHPTKNRRGELGVVFKTQFPHLTETAFKLKPGEYSAPFKTVAGWEIVKVMEFFKAEDTSEEEALKRTKERMLSSGVSQQINQKMQNLRTEYNVQIFPENIGGSDPEAEARERMQKQPAEPPANPQKAP